MAEVAPREFWHKRARMLSRRINSAWFLQVLAGPLLAVALISAIAIVILRRHVLDLELPALIASVLGFVLLTAVICFFVAKRRFERPEQALIRLESGLELNSGLSAAQAGVRAWPKETPDDKRLLAWHLPKTLIPPAVALILLLVGFLIPISPKIPEQADPASQPQAWSQLDSQLEQLADEALVDEEYVEEMKERLEELRAQEEQDWFSHASLEATDTLMDTQNANVEKLEQDIAEARKSLEELTKNAENLTAEQKQKLSKDFESALDGLQNGAMKPNEALLDQLSQLDPNNLGQLDPKQLQQLKDNMKGMQQSLKDLQKKQGEGDGENWDEELMAGELEADGECPTCNGSGGDNGNCQKCNGTGKGKPGIRRGPGHDPDLFGREKDQLEIGELEGLTAKDLSQAVPGDLLQLQDGEHSVDKSASEASLGGNATKGSGGDRVWRDALAPDEQKALKRYFD